MRVTILEQGRYAVLWLKEGCLMLAGEEVVIDVNSEGALFLLSEVNLSKLDFGRYLALQNLPGCSFNSRWSPSR